MTMKRLLVHVDSTHRAEKRLDLAIALARRFDARLSGLFAEAESLGRSVVGRRSRDSIEEAARRAREAFDAKVRAAGVDADWWDLGHAPGEEEDAGLAAVCCRYVDLSIFGQHEEGNDLAPRDLLESALLGSGRPVLVVPALGDQVDIGRRVVVGWNGGREAARAIHDALPLLRGAEAVRLLAFQRASSRRSSLAMPDLDIIGYLAAHGVAAEYGRVVPGEGGAGIADMLLSEVFEFQADLAVLGGQGERFPVPRCVGSTREIMRSMTTPVLLSH